MESAGDDQHCGAKLVQGHEHLLLGLRLRYDPHLVFYGKNFGDPRTEDCLIVGQN